MDHAKSIEYFRTRILDRLKNDFSYFVIGLFVIIAAVAFTSLRFFSDLSYLFNPGTSIEDILGNESTADIEQIINTNQINFISPVVTKNVAPTIAKPTQSVEEGEVSSISSEKVTYTQETYIIQPGESLADVALKVYGDPNAWVKIAEANNITNPDLVEVGTQITIPR